jgi:hypothetical protein
MEQCAFASAGRAAQREKIAARNFKVHTAQYIERTFADSVGAAQIARDD